MLVIRALFVSVNILQLGLNWLMYTMILLYVGGIIVLFIYICRLASESKIEVNGLGIMVRLFLVFAILSALTGVRSLSSEGCGISLISSLFRRSRERVILFLRVYLILGLLVSVSLIEKFQGPLKSSKNEQN